MRNPTSFSSHDMEKSGALLVAAILPSNPSLPLPNPHISLLLRPRSLSKKKRMPISSPPRSPVPSPGPVRDGAEESAKVAGRLSPELDELKAGLRLRSLGDTTVGRLHLPQTTRLAPHGRVANDASSPGGSDGADPPSGLIAFIFFRVQKC